MTRGWIGADVNTEDSECPFCHQHQDKSGHHATVCNTNGDVIYGMASQAALSSQLEKQYILPGTQMKPADLFIPTWSAGKPLAIDISVVSPTQSHLLLYNHTQTEKLFVQLIGGRSRRTQNIWRPFTIRTFCSYPWQLKHLVDGGWRAEMFSPLLQTEFQGALVRQNHVSSTNYTKDWPSHCRGNMPEQ